MQRAELEDRLVGRTPLVAHVGKSGASLERWMLDDGSSVVVKRLTPASDLLMRLTHDTTGREYVLWAARLLDHLPERVGHAVVAGWPAEDGAVLVMRDLGGRVLTWEDTLDRDGCRWVLRRLADLHLAYAGVSLEPWAGQLAPLDALVSMFSPWRMRNHAEGSNPLPRLAVRGWELFETMVDREVARCVLEVLRDPRPLVTALRGCRCTLVHGDFAVVNMAPEGDVLTLLDWSMTAQSPGALDVARFIAGCASVVSLGREEIIEEYAEAAGAAYDERAMRLALVAGAVWLGWNKALDAAEHRDPVVREREREDLEWWARQVREALRSELL